MIYILLRPVVDSIFDDVIRKMVMPAKMFQYILKVYMMVYLITKFRDCSFSQSKDKVAGEVLARPTENEVQKDHPE